MDDPWHSNYAPWTIFDETINSDVNGVCFTTQGTQLQVRGQALKQDAAILSAPKVVPQYAEMGNFVWPENAPTGLGTPTISVTTNSFTGHGGSPPYTYTWTGNITSSPNGCHH